MKAKHKKVNTRNRKGKFISKISSFTSLDEVRKKLETLTTEKEKAEKQAREALCNLEQIIACMPGSVFWKDKNGLYQGCNDAVLKLLDLPRSEVLGKTDYDFAKKLGWSKERTDLFTKIDQEIMQTGIPRLGFEEPPFNFADGKTIYQLDNKVPLRDEAGNIVGVVGIGIDITELKTTQALLKKEKEHAESLSKAKSDFIANMSHDVKTPLSGIIGLSNLLEERLKGEELSFVQDIIISAEQLMGFFNNCLEMAKSENIDMTLIKERFNLQRLTNQISELFRPAIINKKLNFSVHYDSKIPECLLGSHPAVYRVLLNLTGNAIKFTDKGDITIDVSLSKRSTRKKAIVKIVVQDTGIGIPKDKQQVIFEQFTRLTPSYQGLYEGTGIGLFVVNKLIKSLRGEIYVTSEEGKGSKFTAVLPFDIPLLDYSEYGEDEEDNLNIQSTAPMTIDMASNSHTKEIQSFTPKIRHPISKKKAIKVLLVEDNRISQYLEKFILSRLNCEVDIAKNGAQTLEYFEPGKYKLVLMDIGLPDTNGDKLAYQLREKEKEKDSTYQVPIIGLTAHLLESLVASCKTAGMQEVLSKPLSSSQASELINRYVYSNKASTKPAKKKPHSGKRLGLGQDLPETKTELFQLAKYRLLDTETAAKVTSDPTVLKEILEALVKEVIPEEIVNLRASYAEKNWDRIESIAHKLKGGCSYCGAIKMFYACQYLENYHKTGHKQLLKKLYDQCITVLKETQQYVEEWLLLNH